jgi:SAM-dependent methyltransferase
VSLPPLTLAAWLRLDAIERVLSRLPAVRSVLEIGTGTGGVGARLARRYSYTGVELDPTSAALSRANIEPLGGTVLEGSVKQLPVERKFDLVCAFEVLEHAENDLAAVIEWTTYLRPDGWILLSVPAFQRRYGPWDERAGHFRRYEKHQLSSLLSEAGYDSPTLLVYGFPLGNVLEHGRHVVARFRPGAGTMDERTGRSGRAFQPPPVLGWLTGLATGPFRLAQRPFFDSSAGMGLVAVARRSANATGDGA